MSIENGILEGIACYAKVQIPGNKYQSDEKEFSIDVVVDKATYKAWGKKFPKQKGKTVDNEDFKEIFKIDPPFEDQDEQCVLKLKKAASYKDGTELDKKYWPKVLIQKNNKAVAIEEGVLVANGSKVKVSFEIRENSYGTFARLKNVLVTNLIEYRVDGDNGSEFGLEVEDSEKEIADEFSEETKQAPAKKQPKVEPEDSTDEDEYSPF
jgi:hypothetical protein